MLDNVFIHHAGIAVRDRKTICGRRLAISRRAGAIH
jgi:hypothetical protein